MAGALLGGSPCVMGERPRMDRAVGPGYGSPGLAAFGVAGAVRFACARGWQHAVGPKRMDYRQGAASQHKARCGGAHRLTPGTCQAPANTRHVNSGLRVSLSITNPSTESPSSAITTQSLCPSHYPVPGSNPKYYRLLWVISSSPGTQNGQIKVLRASGSSE